MLCMSYGHREACVPLKLQDALACLGKFLKLKSARRPLLDVPTILRQVVAKADDISSKMSGKI